MGMLNDLINKRLQHGFFNTREDCIYRKAYLDSLKSVEGRLTETEAIVDEALKDKKLMTGFSKECLEIFKLLKSDLIDLRYLQPVKKAFPQFNKPFVPPYMQPRH
jgi:hypothetical protein